MIAIAVTAVLAALLAGLYLGQWRQRMITERDDARRLLQLERDLELATRITELAAHISAGRAITLDQARSSIERCLQLGGHR